jgi:ABC-type sulfate transport system permease subunit
MMRHCIALPVSVSPALAGVASLRLVFGDVARWFGPDGNLVAFIRLLVGVDRGGVRG